MESSAGLPQSLQGLLETRGITGDQLQEFLSPSYEVLHDPWLFNDMAKVVARVRQAIKQKEPIVIYGDYDIDGITATVILVETLRRGGAEVDHYIPSRFEEGYGLNQDALVELASRGTKLVITVDSGIVAYDQAAKAREFGLDLIITDHHAPGDRLPDCFGILHPKVAGETYPFKDLSGAGVAWKLAVALIQTSQKEGEASYLPGTEKWLLDLVAMAAVADVVPLIGENRTLVYYGFKVLVQTRRPGIRALAEVAGVDLAKVNSASIGFGLGPRLNASGRLQTAELSLKLLETTDTTEAMTLAKELGELNRQRQSLTNTVVGEARELATKETGPVIFLNGKDWSHGIVGIVAARLTEEFGKPAFIAERLDDESGESKGSARSASGIDLIELMHGAKDLWSRYGGHRQAAGFHYPNQNFEQIKAILNTGAKLQLANLPKSQDKGFDLELDLSELTLEYYGWLSKLEPYGEGNRQPRIKVSATVASARSLSDGAHLKLLLGDQGHTLSVIAFRQGDQVGDLTPGRGVECVGYLDLNYFNGNSQLQFVASIIRPL